MPAKPEHGLLLWLLARGPTAQLRGPADWNSLQRYVAEGLIEKVPGEGMARWRITPAGIRAIGERPSYRPAKDKLRAARNWLAP